MIDAYKASYGVEDPEFAITQLAQTTMRSELGKISLDSVFKERESLNIAIVAAINKASNDWGITCLRYEIRDIKLPDRVQEAMQMQVEAERKKRARVLESEGLREAEINVAEGKKRAQVLVSEALKAELMNKADGQAKAIETIALAKAMSITKVAESLSSQANGPNAAALSVAEAYVDAFKHLAKTNNTLILPTDAGNVSSVVASAMQVYHNISTSNQISKDTIPEVEKKSRKSSMVNSYDRIEYDSDAERKK